MNTAKGYQKGNSAITKFMQVSKTRFIKRITFKTLFLLSIVGILGACVGILYTNTLKPHYQSLLTFAMDEGTGNGSSGVLNLATQFGLNLGGGDKDLFSGDNILEIIKSRRIVERVLLSVDTFENKPYTFIEYYFQKFKPDASKKVNIHFPVDQSRSSFTYIQDSILYATYLEFATSYIIAEKPDRKIGIYEVKITSPNEKFTKDFTDQIVSETGNFYVEIRSKKSKQTLEILEERVNAMKGSLTSSLTSKAKTMDINVNPAFAEADVPIQKQQSNVQVYSGAYTEMFKNLEMARFQYLNQIPLMQIIDTADYPMKKIKPDRLKAAFLSSFLAIVITFCLIWITPFKRK